MENLIYAQRTFLSLEDTNLQVLMDDDIRKYPNLKMLNLRKNQLFNFDVNIFAYNDNLKDIDLSYNRITDINKFWFSKLVNLYSLNLSFNSITFIDKDLFPTSLRDLFLQQNNIETIRKKAFYCTPLLEHLNMNDNVIELRNTETFDENMYLKTLQLRCNKIIKFPFKSKENNVNEFRNLTYLNLLENDIAIVLESTFTGMPNIKVLKLKVIERFTFRSLNKLSDLTKFHLDFYGPKEISFAADFKGELFMRNLNLKKFSISANYIDISKQIKFQKLHNLESLYFESRNSKTQDVGVFNFTKQVNGLNCLQKLTLISCQNFKILPIYQEDLNAEQVEYLNLSGLRNKNLCSVFQNFPNLKELNLSHSKLETLHSKLFKYQTKLEILLLKATRIREIQPKHFSNCILLHTLDLSDCEIDTIRNDSFENLKKMKHLNLNNNPLRDIEPLAFNGLSPSVITKSNKRRLSDQGCSIT